MKKMLEYLSYLTVIFGIVITIWFIVELKFDWLLLDKSGQIGDFIGGVVGTIFSLSAFFLLVLTLYEQTRFSKNERFESKFFDLLKLHRENVVELGSKNSNGRKNLHDIFNQFLICREECQPFFNKKKENDIFETQYLDKLKEKIKITNPKLNLLACAKLDIPYLIIFYGVNAQGKMALEDIFRGKYKETFSRGIIDYFAMKPVLESNYYLKWKRVHNLTLSKEKKVFLYIRELRNNKNYIGDDARLFKIAKDYFYSSEFIKFYGGHQYKLGHYFRHLFLVFTFINEHKYIKWTEKYFYAKILRAQLSNSEQSLLFINSISSLGMVWDNSPKLKKGFFDPFYEKKLKNKRLITNFNLIKNLSGKEVFGIIYKDFYPEVDYEIENN